MGVQQNRNSVQTNRAISALLANCGSLDTEGGHVSKKNKPSIHTDTAAALGLTAGDWEPIVPRCREERTTQPARRE